MVKNISMQQFELMVLRVKDEMPDAGVEERMDELQRRLKALARAARFV